MISKHYRAANDTPTGEEDVGDEVVDEDEDEGEEELDEEESVVL